MSNQQSGSATTSPPELLGAIMAVYPKLGYAVVKPDKPEILRKPGSVTFSLTTGWHSSIPPTVGLRVQLINVFELGKGARAERAEPVSALAEGGN